MGFWRLRLILGVAAALALTLGAVAVSRVPASGGASTEAAAGEAP